MSARNDNLNLSRSNRISNEKAVSSDFAGTLQGDIARRQSGKKSGRRKYARAFRALRTGWHIYPEDAPMGISSEIWECATESFEYRYVAFTGWVNKARRFDFVERLGDDPLDRIPF